MKTIALTQRVAIDADYAERRDCLDQEWVRLMNTCGYHVYPLPNNASVVQQYLPRMDIHGILLTGGNTLEAYGGDAPERDELERYLLEYAITHHLPLLGVCRGMQVIQHYFHIDLHRVTAHIDPQQENVIRGRRERVNSYHDYGTDQTIEELTVWAQADDGVIKGIEHKAHRMIACMWHPERIRPFAQRDIMMIQELFQ